MKKTRIHGVWILFLLSVVTCLQESSIHAGGVR